MEPALVLCGRNVKKGFPGPEMILGLLGTEDASIPLDNASALLRSIPFTSKESFPVKGLATVGMSFRPPLDPDEVETRL